MVRLRPTTVGDLDFVIALEDQPHQRAFIGQWTREEHAETIARPDREHWIIERESDGAPIGYVITYDVREAGYGIYVKRIAVAETSQGAGRDALHQLAERAFRDRHAAFLCLAVRRQNIRAQRAYASIGFEEWPLSADARRDVTTRVDPFADDCFVMRLRPDALHPPVGTAGYRRYKWHDAARQRPVWTDVWYPAADTVVEQPIDYGLGRGSVGSAAPFAARRAPFLTVVMSHGASGSATSYAWLAEYLARRGVVVLGVSHFGESYVYGPDTIDPMAVTRLWLRPEDCSFALTQFLWDEELAAHSDRSRIAALGHSSGGATAVALAGAAFDPDRLAEYCRSDAAADDRGCQYGRLGPRTPPPSDATRPRRDARIAALVLLDPAAGPGFSDAALGLVQVPALVIGSVANDFLPFAHHAGRYASLLPGASRIDLRQGEGHFVYLNVCTSRLTANEVPLCVDRPGVDREAVHRSIAPRVLAFLRETLGNSGTRHSAPGTRH